MKKKNTFANVQAMKTQQVKGEQTMKKTQQVKGEQTMKKTQQAKGEMAMKKEQTVNATTRKETAYVVYMMLGSLFAGCKCKTPGMEEHLRRFYITMDFGKQVKREEQVLRAADKILGDDAGRLAELYSEAYIVQKGDDYVITFETGFDRLEAIVTKSGKVELHLWVCEEETIPEEKVLFSVIGGENVSVIPA